MKIPSLTRLPNHRRFSFEPRYYDPIKEDIEERTSRIEQEIRQLDTESSSRRISFEGAFTRRATQARNASVLQLAIVVLLFILIFGYIYYGNAILYIGLLAIPIYIFFRLRRFTSNRRTPR